MSHVNYILRYRSAIGFIGLALMTSLFSCLRASHKNLVTYQHHPTRHATVPVPLNGIYFLEDLSSRKFPYYLPYAFFLNKNGSLTSLNSVGISDIPEEKFWQYPEEYLSSISPSYGREVGHYVVEGDSIVIEVLVTGIPGLPFTSKPIRFRGTLGDSVMVMKTFFCDWCPGKISSFPKSNNVVFAKPRRYRFYRSANTPDTEHLWFGGDRWYRKNVWYNRKDSANVRSR